MVAIQIRDVSPDVRDALAKEAESRGESLQMFLLDILELEARKAKNRALMKNLPNLEPLPKTSINTVELIRELREERTDAIINAGKAENPQ